MMTAQELATLRQYDARAVFIVVDNGVYGTIRMHQERDYPARVSGTDLKNPDFVQFARAFGLEAWRVETTGGLRPALEAALAAPTGGLIHLITSPEDIAPGRTIAQLRAG
jgi:acetolactate synthase-1/2/3 large subunit